MRVKAALVIIAISFVITAVNFGSSLFLTNQTLKDTMSHDISLARNFVDDLISTKISLLKSNAQTVSERLMKANSTEEMWQVISEQAGQFPDFMGFAVFDHNGRIFKYGKLPPDTQSPDNNAYMQYAFNGETVISTVGQNEKTGELSMYVYTPMDKDHILGVTISGMLFSHLLEGKRIYETGQIFILDEEGKMIVDYHTDLQEDTGSHFHENLIVERTHFSDIPKLSSMLNNTDLLENISSNNEVSGNYSYNHEKYIYSYKHISASQLGWSVVVTAPLSESPAAHVQSHLIMLAAIFLIFSCIMAVVISRYVAKPFQRIAEQNHRLEELNEITQAQKDNIQKAHRITKLMMDATPICSMLWDRDGNIFDCNEESVKHFGMKDKEEFLEHFFELSPEYQPSGLLSRDVAAEHIQKTFDEGRCSCEWMHQLLDGTPIPCEITLVRVSYNDDYIVAAYARDLRKQQQMMAETVRLQGELEDALKVAQEANQAKSSFLAKMSHEMRTPLNAVVGLSELILNTGEIAGEAEDRLEKIYISGMTLLGIVNDILDISKIESGKFELQPAPYSTPSLINDIVSLNIVRIGEKPIQFKLIVDEQLPAQLFGDDLRIKQVFNNLLSNAFKYTNSGEVQWQISFEREGESVWLTSSIKDSGIGIKKEDITKLFIDYSQVDAQTNRQAEGTGLGLAITKRFVDMMDGEITVESEYGKGSVFTVRLRQAFVADTPIGKETAQGLMSERFAVSKRINGNSLVRVDLSYAHVLVVDDVPTNLDVIKGMLKPYGVRVDCASGARQAIDMIRAEKPRYDAVFMDHMMPGMDGIEAVQIIRGEIDTDYAKTIPVIALTANAIAGNEKMFLEHGFQAFISKPIDIMRLDSVLRRWVRNKEREKELDMQRGFCRLYNHKREGVEDPASMEGLIIEGVDTQAGLKRFGHNKDTYLKVLKSYAVNTAPLLESMQAHLAAGNLPAYAIAVHGIKGSSFGAGAASAGKEAERLEYWAKNGEKEQVATANGVFIANMTKLLEAIENAVMRYAAAHKKPPAAAPSQALLQELRAACAAYDIKRVEQALAEVESFEYESGSELVVWLRQQVDDMNFEEIAEGGWMPE